MFDPAVIQSKDEPTSILYAKMMDRNHDLNRTIGVSKIVFDYQFKLPTTIVPSENAVIDGENQLQNSNENKIGGYADYNHDDFLDILSVRIKLSIVSEIRTNNNVFHEAYYDHYIVQDYNSDTTACPTASSVH